MSSLKQSSPFPEVMNNLPLHDRHLSVAPIGLYLREYDQQNNTYSIHKALKLLGHTPEQIAVMNNDQLLELLHPDDRPRLMQYLAGFADANDGEVREFEYRVRAGHKPESEDTWNWFYSRDQVLLRDADNHVKQIVGVVIDLTAHMNREAALKTSEQFNRSILESSPDCIKVLSLDGKLLSMNTPGLCMMEIDDFDSFCGLEWTELWPEETRYLTAEAVENARNGEVGRFRGYCPTAKGTPKWWDVIVSPVLDAHGKPHRLVSVSRDITQFREAERALIESEKKLRLSTIGAQLGLWFWNLETNELSWTDLCKVIFGLSPEAEINYEVFLSILHPEDRERTDQAVRFALEQMQEYNIEYRVIWPDQSVHWIAARGRGFYDENSKAVQMMGIARDVTHRKQAEEERERLLLRERVLREQAEQANRVKEEFLSIVSHELRTPLNHMYGWIKMLRSGQLSPEESAQALETIERNALAQSRMIEDLLDVSRVMSGKLRLDVRQFDAVPVIRAAVEAAQSAAEAKNIQLETRLTTKAGVISGDPDRLQQIVWNLVSNAIKFTPAGGRVVVNLQRAENQFEITVTDTGLGIEAEFLPYVFDRFRQADGSITRRQSGLGLGLAIVRQLVELHGGTVSVESRGAGTGSTFRVFLPAYVLATSEMKKLSAEFFDAVQGINIDELPSLDGLKVLAVDDEPDARHLVSSFLRMAGAEVRTAQNMQEAQNVLADWSPDLLVSDIGMPGGSGYDLIRGIRQQEKFGKHLPAVALTAYGRPEDRMRAISAGFQMHVVKPVEPAELIAVLASLSGRFN